MESDDPREDWLLWELELLRDGQHIQDSLGEMRGGRRKPDFGTSRCPAVSEPDWGLS
jgi:hypothetical protein